MSKVTFGCGASEELEVLLFLDQPGEAQFASPIIREALNRPHIGLDVVLSRRLVRARPDFCRELTFLGVSWREAADPARALRRDEALPGAVFPLVVSTHEAHSAAQGLVTTARKLGIPSFCIQHGVDNIGITTTTGPGSGSVYSIDADFVFVWFPADAVPDICPDNVRSRLVHVGRPASFSAEPPSADNGVMMVGVFENLHWDVYDRAFRYEFQSLLRRASAALPNVHFVVKSHPGGRWFLEHGERDWPAQVRIFDPGLDTWRAYDMPAFMRGLSAVITTPSTIALDAVMLGKPVAVATADHAPLFAELPQLRDLEDWVDFIQSVQSRRFELAGSRRFADRSMIAGDASPRIWDFIVESVTKSAA